MNSFRLLCGLALATLCACQSSPTDPKAPGIGAARFSVLLANPRWYRTFDSSNTILPTEGTLLFAWTFKDSLRHPDSFYVGIDTLWRLPQDVGGDTANDWDLQVCPDGFCAGGLRSGLFGVNSSAHFGGSGEYANPDYVTEHHFQFYPSIDPVSFKYTSPDSGIFGGMLFVRSRSTEKADTVFGFGAWKLEWDSAYLPPVRPVNGYLPKRSDFTIVNGKVRYTAPNLYNPVVPPSVLN